MLFPITELLDDQASCVWVEKHFHPKACVALAVEPRHNRRESFARTSEAKSITAATTVSAPITSIPEPSLQGSNLEPRRVVLLVRGVCKGDPATVLAEELSLSRQSVHRWRKRLQANAYTMLSQQALPDRETETDEMFQNAGKKSDAHRDPLDPPRRRANKRRGHGTYDNDRPPIVGTVGRHSGQCRLRVRHHTDGKTLQKHMHGYTKKQTTCYTDEWQGYNRIKRPTTRCVTGRKNGREMTMAMAYERCISTPSKACGQQPATFCARFAACTRSICTRIWRCANIRSI